MSDAAQLLTSSRAKDGRACKRLHHLVYDEGWRPVDEADVLRFGTLVHLGLEAWWKAKQSGQPTEHWLEAALGAVAISTSDDFEFERVQVMLCGYHERWAAEPYEVLAVEVRFETELRNPGTARASRTWRLAGKIDVLVRDLRDGQVRIVEHKTSSEDVSSGSDYWKKLRMDGQVSVYFEGAAALGYEPSACVYDVLAKPGQRPGTVPLVDETGTKIVLDAQGQRVRTKDGKKWRQTADTEAGFVLQVRPETPAEFRARLAEAVSADPSRYFARGEVVRLESERDEALFDLWQLGQEIREGQVASRFPRNPEACVRYGRTCPFFAVCAGEASLDDAARFVRLADVHPELSNAPSPKEEGAPCQP